MKISIKNTAFLAATFSACMNCYSVSAQSSSSTGVTTPDGSFSLYLRDEFADPSVIDAEKKTPETLAAHPFRLFYQRDEASGNEAYSILGSAFGQWRNFYDDGRILKISAYSLGVEIDQSTINGVTARDTIAVRVGGAWLFQDSRPQDIFFRSHYLSTSVGWITDHDFDLSVVSVDAKYRPLGESFGFGGVPYGRGNFKFQITPVLTAEYLSVIDADGRPNFAGLDEALFIGTSMAFTGSFAEGPLKSYCQIWCPSDFHAAA